MAQKSSNKKHIEKSQLLRDLRKDCGLTQEQLAVRLSVTRDVISHIENCHEQQMNAMAADFELAWWRACKSAAKPETRARFRAFIDKIFGFQ